MKYEAIIFDLDGTLAYTVEDIGDAMNRVLASKGYKTHSYEEVKSFVGRGLRNLVMRSLPETNRSEDEIADCYNMLMNDYSKNLVVKTCLYDGIAELIEKLSKKGYKMAVFSNKTHELTLEVVKTLFPNNPFNIILGAKSSYPSKPDPKGAFIISEELGLSPDKIAYIGDSDVDMITATKAGMDAIGVTWGYRSKADIVKNGATKTADTAIELLDIL